MSSAFGIDSIRGGAALAMFLWCAACDDRPRSPVPKEISVAFLTPIGARSGSVERVEVRTKELLAVVRALSSVSPKFAAGAPLRLPQRIRGPTFTRMPLAGSPAIVRGLFGGTPPTFDQRYTGFPRVVGGRVDVGTAETAGTSGDLDATRALAATGQTLNIWIPIIGGVLLLGGAAAIVINVLRRRRQP